MQHRTTIEARGFALARLAIVLLVALGVVLMHGVSQDHGVMHVALATGHTMTHDTVPGPQGAPAAVSGAAMTTMSHAQCVAVLRAPDAGPHARATPLVVPAANGQTAVSAASLRGRALPSRASPPDLATELCIART